MSPKIPRNVSRVLSPLRAARSLVLACALLALAAGALFAQCETESGWNRVEINVGSLPAPLVENAGQFGAGVEYGAVSAASTGARLHQNGRVAIVIMDLEDKARLSFDFEGADGDPSWVPSVALGGEVSYFGAGSPGTLAAWSAVEAHGVYGGAVGEHRFTGRTWRVRWTGEAADLGRLALRPTGIGEISADEVSGDLEMAVEGLADRRITLHPAVVTLGEETSYIPFTVDAEGVLRLGGQVPEGAVVETVMVFAPYVHGFDAVADGTGGYVAVGAAIDAVETLADGTATGRDVAVVRVAEDGSTWSGLTVLASAGEDVHGGVAARRGDAYVVGMAGAADFPVASKGLSSKAEGQSFPAPFAVRLGVGGSLDAAAYLDTHGLAAARDVAVDEIGRVVVAGDAVAGAVEVGELELTTVLPVEEGAPSVEHAVAVLDAELSAAESVLTFPGPATTMPLQVQISCVGRISVGLALATVALDCDNPHVTEHRYPDPAVTYIPTGTGWLDYYALVRQPGFPYSSHGFHALHWKAYSQMISQYNPTQASYPAVPVGHVAYLDAARLNAIEGDPNVFPNGNPPGIWQANQPTSTQRGLEAALGAAAYGKFWKSPTYLNLDYSGATDGTAVMEVVFCTPNGVPGPIELCSANSQLNGLPIDDFDHGCLPAVNNAANQISFDRVRVHQWFNPIVMQAQELIMPYHEFITRFEQAVPGNLYIADPPEGQLFAAGQVAEIADRQMAFVVEQVAVNVTQYSGGAAVSSGPGLGVVRAIDRTSQTQ